VHLAGRRDVADLLVGEDDQRVLRVVVDRVDLAVCLINVQAALELDLRPGFLVLHHRLVPLDADDALRLGDLVGAVVLGAAVEQHLEQVLVGDDDLIAGVINGNRAE
jgi:hypothetical protein